jgi:hypothetical protein
MGTVRNIESRKVQEMMSPFLSTNLLISKAGDKA